MKHFMHHRMHSPRLPVFLVEIDPPCRDSVKEWRRERWRDWQEANGRAFSANGSHRNLQWSYYRKAQIARRSGNILMARLELSCSKEERLKPGVWQGSPMAFIEQRRDR